MPEAKEKTEQTSEGQAEAVGPKQKKSYATIGLFGGVMIVEGLAIFLCMKFFGSEPDPTIGMMDTLQTTTAPFEESKELEVARVRVQNANGARTTLYSVAISIRVHHDDEGMVADFLKNREATINDSMSRIIRSAEEKHLSEPGLETLKRQIHFELNTLLGGEGSLIEHVLIPEFTPLPTGF